MSFTTNHKVANAGKEKIMGLERPWFYLILGIILAQIFRIGFIFSYVGWFMEALVHEMGHCFVALYFGCSAFPAIRLDGHAAAIHGEQSVIMATITWLVLVGLTIKYHNFKEYGALTVVLFVAAISYPFLARGNAKEFCHLVGGHLGELFFAALFFWRAMAGGLFQESERPVYAMLAWHFWLQNISLCWNLFSSAEARDWYLNNGSFGLENDYVRIAQLLSWRLESVALVMFFVSLIIPVLGILFWYFTKKTQETQS